MGDDALALQAEIAKLRGAITQHRTTSSQASTSQFPSRGGYRGAARGSSFRGGSSWSRGSGRGGSNSFHRAGAAPLPSRHRTLVLNKPTGESAAKENEPPAAPIDPADLEDGEIDPTSAAAQPQQWVKRKTTHNMSLVRGETFEKTEPARLAAIAASQNAKAAAKEAARRVTRSKPKVKKNMPSVRRGDKMGEIIIDGVIFRFDETGEKMIKVGPVPKEEEAETMESVAGPSTATPLNASVDGQQFVRTKNGNLISKEVLNQRKAAKEAAIKMDRLEGLGKSIGDMQRARYASKPSKGKRLAGLEGRQKGLCSFFNKTGICKRGLSCQYKHDPSKVAICHGALTAKGCTKAPGSCLLSHDRVANRVPHCSHYLTGNCRFGDACLYVHSDKVTPDSPLCKEFASLGWCDKGAECDKRHAWECVEFAEKGVCNTSGCKLPHILRANSGASGPATTAGGSSTDAEGLTNEGDGMLFMRDDAAADDDQQEEEEEDEQQDQDASTSRTRKRGSDDEGEEQAEVVFMPTSSRRKKSKAFTDQRDFISFGDDSLVAAQDGEEDDEEMDSEDEEDDHAESVASDEEQEEEVSGDDDDDEDVA